MAKNFAKHAQVGDLHLETRYVPDNGWEWEVLFRRDRLASGMSESLDVAKVAAMTAANVKEETVNWMDIGQQIPK